MKILVPILFIIAFSAIIFFFKWFKVDNIKRPLIHMFFAIKLLGGVAIFAIYSSYYDINNSDIYKYYKGGKEIYKAKEEMGLASYIKLVTGIDDNSQELYKYKDNTNVWSRQYDFGLYNDCRTIIRFNALLLLISNDNILVHIVIMAFLSFLGCFALFKSFMRLLPKTNKYLLLAATFVIPSCLIWTSGLLKEGLAMFSMGFLMYFFTKIYTKFRILDFLFFIVFCCALFISKVYILPALLPALLFMFVTKRMNIKQQFLSLTILFFVCSSFLFFSDKIIDYDIIEAISQKRNVFINFLEVEGGGSSFVIDKIDTSNKMDFVKIIPEALVNSFFRPFVSNINSPLLLLSFIEVCLLFCLLLVTIFLFKKPDAETCRFIITSLIFVFVFYTLVGVITPNIGALVRYRTPALPFIVAAMFGMFSKIPKTAAPLPDICA